MAKGEVMGTKLVQILISLTSFELPFGSLRPSENKVSLFFLMSTVQRYRPIVVVSLRFSEMFDHQQSTSSLFKLHPQRVKELMQQCRISLGY